MVRWRPEDVLPSPVPTLQAVWKMMSTDRFRSAIATTLTRAVAGFAPALLIGITIGVSVARIRPLRLAVGALTTGLPTMPSISWFPLAILLFGLVIGMLVDGLFSSGAQRMRERRGLAT